VGSEMCIRDRSVAEYKFMKENNERL